MNNVFEDSNADDDDNDLEANVTAVADETLFEMLKQLRQKKLKNRSSTICDFFREFFAGYGNLVSNQTRGVGSLSRRE